MRRHARHSLVLSSAITMLAALGCAGCALTVPTSTSCSWADPGAAASPASTAGATSNTVVMIDTSASYWPRKGGSTKLPDSSQEAVNQLLRNFGQAGTQLVSLGTFNGSSTTITWQLADAPLPTAAGTAGAIGKQKTAEGTCVQNVINKAAQTAPAAAGTDVMGALDAAGTKLGSTRPDRSQVVLITDGLSNTGCLNLNQVFSEGESPSDVVRSCTGQGGLSRLRGVSLTLAGIGFQALEKPLTTSEQNWLVSYWRDICSALSVAAAPSCVTSSGDSTTRTSDIVRPLDPPISFPTVTGPQIVIPVPLLFAFNSSTLTQTARSYLDILTQKIRSSGLSVTQVIGHTDRVGTAAYNLTLSLRRAQAVQSYLAERGFSGISAKGVGFSQPACPNEYTPSGQPDQKCMAKDRRVVILLGGHK